ncbi:MAG: SpoIIE family protein phosphatase, partial [Duodenibacillus sp.]|nr:SpoIIE family protein phosphatase [Duodenibacillus sp.]
FVPPSFLRRPCGPLVTMRFEPSLRVKLVLIIALIVSLATLPLIYLGYRDTLERAVASAQNHFEQMSRIVNEGIQLSYLNVQTSIIDKTAFEKDDMLTELDYLEEVIINGILIDRLPVFDFMQDKWLTYTAVFDANGQAVLPCPVAEEAFTSGIQDYLGVTLSEYLKPSDRNFARDFFTFFRMDTPAGKNMPLAMALRKSGNQTLVVIQTVDYLEEAIPDKWHTLSSHIRDVVKTLDLHERATASIMTGKGDFVASQGPAAFVDRFAYSPEIYEAARRDGLTSGILTDSRGGTLYTLRYFAPLDWYIQTSIPMSVIEQPAKNRAFKLLGITLALFVLIAAVGLFFVTLLLRPLRRLVRCAERLEKFDFKTDNVAEGLDQIARRLPRESRDEVGQVSNAFGRMIRAMEKSIADLKQSVARQHSIEGELNAARDIQRGMLPPADKGFRGPGYEAAALMEAAKEVGGDLYDVLETPDGRRAFVIGDVSGKGVSAALFMSVTLTLVRTAVSEGLTPAEVVKKVNDQLALNNPSCMFVTLWIGYLDAATGALEFANGGHCPPIAVSRTGDVRWVRDLSGPLVGALDMADFTGCETTLAPGELFLIYTDGVSEAMNGKKELFGESRIEGVMAQLAGETPDACMKRFMQAIGAHRAGTVQSDDITMLAFTRCNEEPEQ